MADSQGVPVFMRDGDDGERSFLGRFPVADLDALVASIKTWGCWNGDDYRNDPTGQFVCSERFAETGFEIILLTDETIN